MLLSCGSRESEPPPAAPDTGPSITESTKRIQELINPAPPIADGETIWLGADSAASVEITPARYVWLFGDSYLGTASFAGCPHHEFYCDRVSSTGIYPTVHNTAGVATRRESGVFSPVEKSWLDVDGKPGAIFQTTDEYFYWPLAGLMLTSKLLVTTARLSSAGGLDDIGTSLFLIDNPNEEPQLWTMTEYPLGGQAEFFWTTALVGSDDWVYLFGYRQAKGEFPSGTYVSRIAFADAEAGDWKEREYWSISPVDGQLEWSSTFDPRQVKKLGLPPVTETSIEWDPDRSTWYSVQIPASGFAIHLYTAPELVGPWKSAGDLAEVASVWSAAMTGKDHTYMVYAAKAHPELAATAADIVITYNVNLAFGIEEDISVVMRDHPGFYVPRVVVASWPKASAGSGNDY